MDKKHIGAHSELAACAWLLRNGYEVYRNVSPHGLVDVIATKDGKIYKFDVTTGITKKVSKGQAAEGVLVLVVLNSGDCFIDFNPLVVGKIVQIACKHCSTIFMPRKRRQVFCTDTCNNRYQYEQQRIRQANSDSAPFRPPPLEQIRLQMARIEKLKSAKKKPGVGVDVTPGLNGSTKPV
jgi:hypothetical protein